VQEYLKNSDMWRLLDIIFATLGLLAISPLCVVVVLVILITDGRPIFFVQRRVGRTGSGFPLIKFRSMKKRQSDDARITIVDRDPRVTQIGNFIRRWKIDELPQLINVLLGQMSIVGPRPEVQEYVDRFPTGFAELLKVRPGITSPASIEFRRESELLAEKENPESYYLNVILPQKIALDRQLIINRSLKVYFSSIFRTITSLFDSTLRDICEGGQSP